MPGFDGTGPMGMGPMTGGGRGFCALPVGQAGNRAFIGRFPGRGGGRGRRNWYWATEMPGWIRAARGLPAFGGWVNPSATGLPTEKELDMLKNQAEFLKRQLEEIQARIANLEKS